MKHQPVIFLTFANDRQGRFLEALRPEQDGINYHLAPFQKDHGGIVYNSAASGANRILEGLNQFAGQLIVFHFSGHSDGKSLQLEGTHGEEVLLNGENLTHLLIGEAKAKLKLVVLNACLSKGMLTAFQKIGVPAVVATETRISDETAKDFAIAFYRSLAAGNTLETAFTQSKTIIAPDDKQKRIYAFRDRMLSWDEEQPSQKKDSFWGLYTSNDES